MKHCCSICIENVADGGIVNFGGAYQITPIMVSKTVEGSGGSNTGYAVENFLGDGISPVITEET
ncbi:spore germination protein [Bacillus changyiensis]|uniref:spore germination protein n=1 Tax=Bacillus changyiensis TaxID=3004103 RepID=UPI0022E81321|nr:spore germination protein [Bacillus changyiensis]MDA1475954.1 spore germination protein [Bacillus changyiensis]